MAALSVLHPPVESAKYRRHGLTADRRYNSFSKAVAAAVAATNAGGDATCLQHIARFKRPKQYRRVAALPKNHRSKVLKTTLR